ncbi:hypothetical protein [Tautonia sociabilis]|uniref:Uncharacterized protein n=1 Tax=Tautonia sociabilis TaxID=2080755 RepID=A0A432MGD1_9BACT|nr:hypothetical protein [Tautonia sociabilis]RUL85703.1 hypothetical protein TsocGM_17670 [Tautonia sociabilis]
MRTIPGSILSGGRSGQPSASGAGADPDAAPDTRANTRRATIAPFQRSRAGPASSPPEVNTRNGQEAKRCGLGSVRSAPAPRRLGYRPAQRATSGV